MGVHRGTHFFLINEILKNKNITLDACFGINMRTNYIVEYETPKIVYRLSKNHQQKIDETAKKIVQKEIISLPKRKVKLFYYMNKKIAKKFHDMDRDYNVSEECIGCSLCSKVCSVQNIEMVDGMPTFKHQCEQCVACIHICYKKALNYKNRTQKRSRYIHPDISVNDLIVTRD